MDGGDNTQRMPNQSVGERRRFLRKGLGVVGAALSPLGASVAAADDNPDRFEVRAAEGVEFRYHFKAAGPIEPVTDPEKGPGAEPGPDGNDTVEQLSDGQYRVSGTTGLGENDIWRIGRLLGFWTDASVSDYTLFVNGDEFSWYSADNLPAPETLIFEIRAAEDTEFQYEFVCTTSIFNVTRPKRKASELFGNDYVLEPDDGTYHVRGTTGLGESDAWLVNHSHRSRYAVTDFDADAPSDEYTLIYASEEISPSEVA